MQSERWDRPYKSYREFYESTYGDSLVEHREVQAAGASILYCRQGAGDWSDPATPDLCIAMQRTTNASGRADIGAGAFRLSPVKNQGIIVAPNTETVIHVDRPHDILVLAMPFDKLKHLFCEDLPDDGDLGLLHAQELNDPFFYTSLERLWLECDAGNPHGRLFAEGALTAMAASLLRLSGLDPVKTTARGGLAPWQVRRSTEALRNLLAENISLSEIASEVGLSPFHFSRAFKHSLGDPPHRYRTRLRLEEACRLLETTNAPITEIALAVGYDSSQALARIFMRDFGVTPTNWRRERRR